MWVDATWIPQELGTQEVLQNPMPWRPKRGSIIWNKSSEDLTNVRIAAARIAIPMFVGFLTPIT